MPVAGLGRARREFAGLLDAAQDTVTLLRRSEVSDGAGGTTISEETIDTYPCLVKTRTTATEVVSGGRIVALTLHDFYLPYGTEVTSQDILLHEGIRYEVADDTGSRTLGMATVVTARRVA